MRYHAEGEENFIRYSVSVYSAVPPDGLSLRGLIGIKIAIGIDFDSDPDFDLDSLFPTVASLPGYYPSVVECKHPTLESCVLRLLRNVGGRHPSR